MPKSTIDDLALFGGQPAFAEQLCVGRPHVGCLDRLLARMADILQRGELTNGGPYVRDFEERIATFIGVKHCIAVANATLGLELAAKALDLSGEVIMPAFTFIATTNALKWIGITPVFCDIDLDTHCIDPARVEELITPRTTGLVGVHLWGRPCDAGALEEIAGRRGLKLMFDAAQGFGCSYRTRMIGQFGALEVFSFHATKIVNSFEGGAIVTNDDDVAARLRLLRNHGFSGYDQVDCLGINAKMSEASAAMGLTSLESMDSFVAANRAHYYHYASRLARLPGVKLLPYDENERCTFQYVVLQLDESKAGISRDTLLQILHAERVIARRYFFPGCHRSQPYGAQSTRLPNTDLVAGQLLCLPTGSALDEPAVEMVCDLLELVFCRSSEVSRRARERF